MALVPVACHQANRPTIVKELIFLLLPFLRPLLIKLAILLGALVLAWGVLYVVQQTLLPDWQQAQSRLQAAQSQLGEAQADQTELETHRRTYEMLKASGLLGGEPRAIWVEDLLRISSDLGLQAHISFTLGSPQAVDLPQAQAIGAKVTRHTLEYSFSRVHELEVLQLTQQYLQAHQDLARLMGCQLDQPTAQGLSARCRVNFLHIEPPAAQGQNRVN
jgi:hypothetical protein